MCKLSSTKYWEGVCASCVVRSRTGLYFVQVLQYKVVPGSACASFVVRSTGKCFVEPLSYEVVLESTLCKFCGAGFFFGAIFAVHRMDFVRKVRKCQEKEIPRMKKHLKIKGPDNPTCYQLL